MKKYFLVLLACFVNLAFAQNSSTVSLGGSNSNSEDTGVVNLSQPQEMVRPSRLENVKNNYSRSILNSPYEYAGAVLSYMPSINSEGKDFSSFSGSYLFSSLWGIKAIYEKSSFSNSVITEYYGYAERSSNVKSFKVGANKLFPVSSNIAFETGLFYEKGKVDSIDLAEYPYYEVISESVSFSAGSALVGVNLFSGNFVAGIQFQQRFAASDLYMGADNRFRKATTLTGNIGICF